ncbi:unnamed protein product [Hermetia illucens]|uniref:Uncharacterized protein n=1 Tax=Hermetia illucens TaxID=343691 RepID=A0A7R8UKM5_HERIL|nr:unnamed protein product [Hermetia illucens]
MEHRSSEEICGILPPRKKVNYSDDVDSEDEIDAVEEDDSCNSEARVSDIEAEEVDDAETNEDVNEQQNAPTRKRIYAYGKDNVSGVSRFRRVNKSNRVDVKEFWAHDFGTMLCKVTYKQAPVDRGGNVPTYYMRKLSEPIHDTPQNITCDT